MPDKPLTVLTYAASASLAAIALVYFLNPAYIFDPGAAVVDARIVRKGRAVGLSNPANDCFINSVLQALAGIGGLQLYLVRELALRDGDDEDEHGKRQIYEIRNLVGDEHNREGSHHSKTDTQAGKDEEKAGTGEAGTEHDTSSARTSDVSDLGPALEAEWRTEAGQRKLRSLLGAEVTRGLQKILNQLNERPTARKTISASTFVRVLESAFSTRVNRNQQDAQELLQIVAERMAEEHAAGRKARKRAASLGITPGSPHRTVQPNGHVDVNGKSKGKEGNGYSVPDVVSTTALNGFAVENFAHKAMSTDQDTFPLQGQTKHQIECEHCHFIPSSKPTDFIMLTLSVPAKGQASVDECLDDFSKPEYIDDYKCDRCRLEHAIGILEQDLAQASTKKEKEKLASDLTKLELAMRNDPEKPPADVALPDSKLAPTRRIARSVRIVSFPQILVLHLSRSAFDPTAYSSKNMARVGFSEHLKLGTLTNRRAYRLIAVITHKGTHQSGHYETFRRIHAYPLSMEDLAAAQDAFMSEGEAGEVADVTRVALNSPTPDGRSPTSNAASPSLANDNDSDIEAEALDVMNDNGLGQGEHSKRHGLTKSIRRNPFSRRSPQSASPRTSSDSAAASSLSPPPQALGRTSLSTLPTPESVLEQASVGSNASAQGSMDASSITGDSSAAPAVAGLSPPPALERTSSRQMVRERISEAKERKREKRLRKLAARENQKWWRISDDKIRECRTQELLEMQKDAYLLFYEMEPL